MIRPLAVACLLSLVPTSSLHGQCQQEALFLQGAVGQQRYFGQAVDVSGERAIVGGWPEHVVTYERVAGAWQVDAVLPREGDPGALFGSQVAIDGDLAVVAAPYDSTLATRGGAVHIYRRGPGGWTLEQSYLGDRPGGLLGTGLDLQGERVAAGAPHSDIPIFPPTVHLYTAESGAWTGLAVFAAPAGLGTEASFGASLSLDGDTLAVGALSAQGSLGLAYVFDKQGGTIQTTELQPADVAANDLFGLELLLEGSRLYVSSRSGTTGAVYVFDEQGSSWAQTAKLEPTSASMTRFGEDLAWDGSRLFAAGQEGPGETRGVIHVLTEVDGQWEQLQRFEAEQDSSGTAFARDLALDAGRLLVGAQFDDTAGLDAGAVYAFDLAGVGLPLSSCDTAISLAAPAAASLELRAGASSAGLTYVVLGSVSGSAPGVTIQGVPIPLNLDPYFLFTVDFPNSAVLQDSLGSLDEHGQAEATFQLPPGLPASAIGVQVQHAFVVLDGGPVSASNALSFPLVP